MKKNEVFHTEESHNPKRQRRHEAMSQTQNHAKLRPRMIPLNNEIHDTFSLFLSKIFNMLIFNLIIVCFSLFFYLK